jgi:hypothetical protein
MVFLFSTCNIVTQPLKDQIFVRFPTPSFNGDWSHFNGRIDALEVTFNDDIYLNSSDRIRLRETMHYSPETNLPFLPFLDTASSIIFRPKEKEPLLKRITTKFFRGGADEPNPCYYDIFQKLQLGTINDITLRYNMDETPLVHFSATIENEVAIVTSDSDELYNFNVRWDDDSIIKKSKFAVSKSINFVVMAEGYRVDEIRYFREYAKDAFANAGSFHYTEQRSHESPHKHIPNKFFIRWWDYINVFMFETVSPHSGIDADRWHNNTKSFFNIKHGWEPSGDTKRMKKVIDVNRDKTGLSRSDVDVYIILTNDADIGAYSFSYVFRVDRLKRNFQPVTWVVIQAPAGQDNINDRYFHRNVKTDAIAHELGHAIAQLRDEYDTGSIVGRNLSTDGEGKYKWQRLIDVDSRYLNLNPVSMPYNDNKLVENYKPYGVYIPTMSSTMRGESGVGKNSNNYQFGPVNTYFMEGSFRVRLGMLLPQNPIFFYEWHGFSFEDFAEKWKYDEF